MKRQPTEQQPISVGPSKKCFYLANPIFDFMCLDNFYSCTLNFQQKCALLIQGQATFVNGFMVNSCIFSKQSNNNTCHALPLTLSFA